MILVYLGILVVVVLLRPYPLAHQVVANRVGHGLVEVVVGGYVAVLDEGMVEVAVEGPLDSCHVLQLRNVPHGDLLLSVAGALRGRHSLMDFSSLS